jgi:hypothetical protein
MEMLLGKVKVEFPLHSRPAAKDYPIIINDYRVAAQYAASQERYDGCSAYLRWLEQALKQAENSPPSSLRVTVDWDNQ